MFDIIKTVEKELENTNSVLKLKSAWVAKDLLRRVKDLDFLFLITNLEIHI